MYKVPNTNDGSNSKPYLRTDLNMGTLGSLPEWSTAPTGSDEEILKAVKAAGYQGTQGGNLELCQKLGLGCTTGGRVNGVGEIDAMAETWANDGYDAATLHVGWGMEEPEQILAIVTDIIEASSKHNIGLYIETHRATITQDMWRTVWLTREIPDVRFNGDFSHWYTGLEMVYGGFEEKLEFIAPVLDRVRFLHGRIGNPGSIQVDIGDGSNRSYVDHFKAFWTKCFKGFLKDAQPGDYISFNPELLESSIYYARNIPDADGNPREEGDRWEQALIYTEIAKECFAVAELEMAK